MPQVSNTAGGGAAAAPSAGECGGLGPALLVPHLQCRGWCTGAHMGPLLYVSPLGPEPRCSPALGDFAGLWLADRQHMFLPLIQGSFNLWCHQAFSTCLAGIRDDHFDRDVVLLQIPSWHTVLERRWINYSGPRRSLIGWPSAFPIRLRYWGCEACSRPQWALPSLQSLCPMCALELFSSADQCEEKGL